MVKQKIIYIDRILFSGLKKLKTNQTAERQTKIVMGEGTKCVQIAGRLAAKIEIKQQKQKVKIKQKRNKNPKVKAKPTRGETNIMNQQQKIKRVEVY